MIKVREENENYTTTLHMECPEGMPMVEIKDISKAEKMEYKGKIVLENTIPHDVEA